MTLLLAIVLAVLATVAGGIVIVAGAISLSAFSEWRAARREAKRKRANERAVRDAIGRIK